MKSMANAKIIGKVGGLTVLAMEERAKGEKNRDRVWILIRQKTKDPIYAITMSLSYQHSCNICFQVKE